MELTPQQVTEMDRRIAAVQEAVNRSVWIYRQTTYKHKCEDGQCHRGDSTYDVYSFYESILEEFKKSPKAIEQLCEALAVAVSNLAKIKVEAPKHLYVADDEIVRCTCGETFDTDDEWSAHANGRGLVLVPWQMEWLEASNRGAA